MVSKLRAMNALITKGIFCCQVACCSLSNPLQCQDFILYILLFPSGKRVKLMSKPARRLLLRTKSDAGESISRTVLHYLLSLLQCLLLPSLEISEESAIFIFFRLCPPQEEAFVLSAEVENLKLRCFGTSSETRIRCQDERIGGRKRYRYLTYSALRPV